MSEPGVEPVNAFAFISTIDDLQRFTRASDVSAYFGHILRRYQSGEKDLWCVYEMRRQPEAHMSI